MPGKRTKIELQFARRKRDRAKASAEYRYPFGLLNVLCFFERKDGYARRTAKSTEVTER